MTKIICFPELSSFHAARDRTFFIDLSESKGSPFYIVAFTLSHESHDYFGRPHKDSHYSMFHYQNSKVYEESFPDIRNAIINRTPLTEEQLSLLDSSFASTSLSGKDVFSHRFSVSNPSELEEAMSLMQKTRPLKDDEHVRNVISRYVSPFLESSSNDIVFPHIFL